MTTVELEAKPPTRCKRCEKVRPVNGYGYCYQCQDELDEAGEIQE